MRVPHDHIVYILIAFLAVLGSFTATQIIGVDATAQGTLRDVLLALAGALGGLAVGAAKVEEQPPQDEEP